MTALRTVAFVAFVAPLVFATSARAELVSPRAAYVDRALTAMRALGPARRAALEHALYDAARTTCHGDRDAPAIDCVIAAATATCSGDASCELAADVIITNLRARAAWLDEPTRARIVREAADYHAGLIAALDRRFAALAAELAIAGGRDGTAIDALCVARDRVVRACRDGDDACVASVPWSRCVAALVWFVGGTR